MEFVTYVNNLLKAYAGYRLADIDGGNRADNAPVLSQPPTPAQPESLANPDQGGIPNDVGKISTAATSVHTATAAPAPVSEEPAAAIAASIAPVSEEPAVAIAASTAPVSEEPAAAIAASIAPAELDDMLAWNSPPRDTTAFVVDDLTTAVAITSDGDAKSNTENSGTSVIPASDVAEEVTFPPNPTGDDDGDLNDVTPAAQASPTTDDSTGRGEFDHRESVIPRDDDDATVSEKTDEMPSETWTDKEDDINESNLNVDDDVDLDDDTLHSPTAVKIGGEEVDPTKSAVKPDADDDAEAGDGASDPEIRDEMSAENEEDISAPDLQENTGGNEHHPESYVTDDENDEATGASNKTPADTVEGTEGKVSEPSPYEKMPGGERNLENTSDERVQESKPVTDVSLAAAQSSRKEEPSEDEPPRAHQAPTELSAGGFIIDGDTTASKARTPSTWVTGEPINQMSSDKEDFAGAVSSKSSDLPTKGSQAREETSFAVREEDESQSSGSETTSSTFGSMFGSLRDMFSWSN